MSNETSISLTIDPQGGGKTAATGSPPQRVVGPNGVVDKDVLLKVAIQIEAILERKGIRVAVTRKSDRNLSQAKRSQVARDSGSKAFVSLCFSEFADADAQGVGARVHAKSETASTELASRLQSALAEALSCQTLDIEVGSFGGLRPDRLPKGAAACEISIGNLSDPQTADRMADDAHLQKIAETISDVLVSSIISGRASPGRQVEALLESADAAQETGTSNSGSSFENREDSQVSVIVIDPGHGGTANLPCSSWNNAVGLTLGTLEKDLTLDIGLRVEKVLQNKGFTNVVLTRRTDVNIGGRDRAKAAKTHNADVLVSIHFNGSVGHNAQGTETFIHRDNSITGPSAVLCRSVQASVLRATGLRDRNALWPPHFVKTAGWCVINPRDHASNTAAVLTEVSFLDRRREEERLQRESYRDEIAFAIADGIEAYLASAAPSDDILAFADTGIEFEDALSQAAYEAGMSVAEMMGITEGPPQNRRNEQGGHAIASSTPAFSNDARASVCDIARVLAAPAADMPADVDERSEGEHLSGEGAVDLSTFGQDATADVATIGLLFGDDMTALTAFDHPGFADKVRSWNLRYFQPIELLYLGASNGAGGSCAGQNSLPPEVLWDRAEASIKMLDEIRHRHGAPIRIISGYRSEAYNQCIEGASNSLHKQFNAFDWTSTSGTVAQWHAIAKQVRSERPEFAGGIGDYPARNFVHIDTRGVVVNF